MSEPGTVRYSAEDGVATIVFDRPAARNALTWQMYEELARICETVAADRSLHAVIFRGAGEGAFVAGTDIAQFERFAGGEDGIAYERRIDAGIESIERLPIPSIAAVTGVAAGAGLMIATACDFRFATPDARFGVPIARTVGNCLSMANVARLLAAFGPSLTRRMLLLAETLTASEAAGCRFAELVPADEIDGRIRSICRRLGESAPLTVRASREAIRRLTLHRLPDGDDLIRLVYGSADFKAGVAAFMAKERPEWQGR
jgi:enoyl-CoA hydratase/carnithine racemase